MTDEKSILYPKYFHILHWLYLNIVYFFQSIFSAILSKAVFLFPRYCRITMMVSVILFSPCFDWFQVSVYYNAGLSILEICFLVWARFFESLIILVFNDFFHSSSKQWCDKFSFYMCIVCDSHWTVFSKLSKPFCYFCSCCCTLHISGHLF